MRKNRIIAVSVAAVMSLSSVFSSFAGQWMEDEKGKWYEEDGSYITSSWKEIEGKQYYFGSDGYMLVNTTTPDGYKVGADGTWIQGNNVSENNSEYYCEENGQLMVTSQAIFHSKIDGDYIGLYCCNLDGTNDRFIAEKVYLCAKGIDDKVYYTYFDYLTGQTTLNRFNANGTVKEEGLCVFAGANDSIRFADATGIQLTNGYYDIATGQYHEGVIKQREQSPVTYDVTESIKAAIPHKDYESATVRYKAGDYILVCTYVYNENNPWYAANDLIGSYIINTKTNTCVAYKKGTKGNPATNAYPGLHLTDLGLMAGDNRRVEDGGNSVKLFDYSGDIRSIKIKGTSIYYLNQNLELCIINNIAPAAFPTSKAVSQDNY